MALKMRQSLADFEQEFRHEMQLDRTRREALRRQAVKRSRVRKIERRKKKSSLRFWVLVASIVLTAVAVTVAMFETLTLLLG